MRSEKLVIKEREFANNLEEHERLKEIRHKQLNDISLQGSHGETEAAPTVEMPAGNEHKENDEGHDENETGENDMAPHVSGDVGSFSKENDHEDGTVGIDASHAAKDRQIETPDGTFHDEDIEEGEFLPMDTPDVGDDNNENSPRDVLSPASEHEIRGDPLQVEQIPDTGVEDDQIIPRVEPDMLSPVSVVQVNTINLQPSSADKLDQTILDDELDATVAEKPSDTVQHNQNTSDVEPDMQPSGAGQVDQMITDDEPDLAVAENLSDMAPQTGPLLEPVCNPLITTQTNQLQAEVERLNRIRDAVSKSYQDEKQKLNSECEKEIAEVVAQIRLKYEVKQQHTDSDYKLKNKELEKNIKWANTFKTLAEVFRSMCEEDLTPDHPGVQGILVYLNNISDFNGIYLFIYFIMCSLSR
ncbi:uncharacterized protein LOC143609996 [Bidens hawaiensis]|uniref:uncharacterized protein LOC143609996 n=1 Tax=Bidens hawaiensis TaxID=980011 RepID=UPI004049701D